jgi:Domain of unknown function (DUF5615)
MRVGTLSTELGAVIQQGTTAPRVYADANVPAGLVGFMRRRLGWDVFFVMEDAELRRASDVEHFRLARRLHRTLITLDRDYFDDRRFPPAESSGVIVVSAPDERLLARVLGRVDRFLLRPAVSPVAGAPEAPGATPAVPGGLPLAGRKVHATVDWPRPPDHADAAVSRSAPRPSGSDPGTRHARRRRRHHRRDLQ